MKKRKRLLAFFKALFHHWRVLLFSLLGLISLVISYLPFQIPRFLPVELAVGLVFIVILIASFYVYCDQANAVDLLTAQASDLKMELVESGQSVASLQTRLNQERLANEDLLEGMKELKDQVTRLSQKPYDEQKLVYTTSLLSSLRYFERDLLRFLLVNGDSRADAISLAAANVPGGFELGSVSRDPVQRGLVHRTDYSSEYSMFSINRELSDVLKDLLFPRKEEKPSFFKGLDRAVKTQQYDRNVK